MFCNFPTRGSSFFAKLCVQHLLCKTLCPSAPVNITAVLFPQVKMKHLTAGFALFTVVEAVFAVISSPCLKVKNSFDF